MIFYMTLQKTKIPIDELRWDLVYLTLMVDVQFVDLGRENLNVLDVKLSWVFFRIDLFHMDDAQRLTWLFT